MKIRKLAKDLAQLIETEMMRLHKSRGGSGEGLPPTVQDLTELITSWRIGTTSQDMIINLHAMGGGQTIYLKLGAMYFALLQNWDANPDGLNRYLIVLPMHASYDGRRWFHGLDEIPIAITADALEVFVNILAKLHNAKP